VESIGLLFFVCVVGCLLEALAEYLENKFGGKK
jgi:hypothetical protein